MNASYTFGMYNVELAVGVWVMFGSRGVTECVAEQKTFAAGDTHTKHEQS